MKIYLRIVFCSFYAHTLDSIRSLRGGTTRDGRARHRTDRRERQGAIVESVGLEESACSELHLTTLTIRAM